MSSINHPGLSRYHHAGLITPLLAIVALPLTAHIAQPNWPQALNALLAGSIITVTTYIIYTKIPYLKEDMAFGKAVMLGLLHAEFSVFTRSSKFPPSILTFTFFLFMYFYSFTDIDSHIRH